MIRGEAKGSRLFEKTRKALDARPVRLRFSPRGWLLAA